MCVRIIDTSHLHVFSYVRWWKISNVFLNGGLVLVSLSVSVRNVFKIWDGSRRSLNTMIDDNDNGADDDNADDVYFRDPRLPADGLKVGWIEHAECL